MGGGIERRRIKFQGVEGTPFCGRADYAVAVQACSRVVSSDAAQPNVMGHEMDPDDADTTPGGATLVRQRQADCG